MELKAKPISKAIQSKNKEDLAAEGIVPVLQYLSDAFTVKVTVIGTVKVKDHYEFILQILGRSRFCPHLTDITAYNTFTCNLRYQNLKAMHDDLKEELAAKIASASYKLEMPTFPGKVWLTSQKKIAGQRVPLLNSYFEQLYVNFGSPIIFSETLLDYFAPKPVNVFVFSQNKTNRDGYLTAMMQRLFKLNPIKNASVTNSLLDSVQTLTSESSALTQASQVSTGKEKRKISEEYKKYKWKNYVPFDYAFRDKLFRVGIVNRYYSKGESLFGILEHAISSQAAIFFIIDFASKENLEATIKLLATTMELKKFKSVRLMIIGTNREYCKESEGFENMSDFINKLLGAECNYPCAECSFETGEGILESLESYLLDEL